MLTEYKDTINALETMIAALILVTVKSQMNRHRDLKGPDHSLECEICLLTTSYDELLTKAKKFLDSHGGGEIIWPLIDPYTKVFEKNLYKQSQTIQILFNEKMHEIDILIESAGMQIIAESIAAM